MVSSLFIDRVRCRSYSAIGSTDKPRLRCKLLTEWQPGFYFFGGAEVTPTPLIGATLTFSLKNKATGAALLHTTTFTELDEGHQADFASVDSPGLRTLLGDEVSIIVTGEIEWVIAGRALRATVDVLVENAINRPDDVAPNPVEEASEAWLTGRAVRYDTTQALSDEEKLQARENIGAGTDTGDGFSGSYNDLTDKPTLGTAAAKDVGTAAGSVCAGDDSRLSDARLPTGVAGGVLNGTYPNPGFAVDLATQAELEAGLAGKASTTHTHAQSDITGLVASLAAKAPLASPDLTGTPTAPTAAIATNTTQLATTAFVQAAHASSSPAYAASVTTDAATVGRRGSISISLTGDVTINPPTNGVAGQCLTYMLTASGGARTITLHASIKIPVGSSFDGALASGSVRHLSLHFTGAAWQVVRNLQFT